MPVDLISTDTIRAELYGDEAIVGDSEEVFEEAFRRQKSAMDEGKIAIFNSTNADKTSRAQAIEQARNNGAEIVFGLYVKVMLETALERNANRQRHVPQAVILRMFESLRDNPPSVDDGFDEVFVIDND